MTYTVLLERATATGPVRRLADMIANRARLSDRSLFVKFAAAPAVMFALFMLAAVLSIGALFHAQRSTEQIVAQEMRQIARLNSISARFERADGDLYRLLVAKASNTAPVDVPGRAAAIKHDLGRVRQDLIALRPKLADKAAIGRTLVKIEEYAASVDVVTAMLDIDFASSTTMLTPFRANAQQVVREVNMIADAGIAQADAHAAAIASRIRFMAILVALATLAVALLGILLTSIIGRATVRSITGIAEATSALAGANYDIDLDALDRRDELGGVVAALKTFRHQAIAAQRVQRDKQGLEEKARTEDARHREAVARTMRDAEQERRETLNRLAGEFDSRVATMIHAAQSAMARFDSSSERLDLSARSNRTLSIELEKLAELLTGEMERAGAATEALTASIREIDREVGQTSAVAQSILELADRARVAVADSESKAEDVEHIVGVIEQIAKQTRLLALNATIEAARAGTVGRGFGVVASEIKSLSSRTGGSTNDVRRQVGAIQNGIGRIVDVTTRLGGLIESMNQVATRVAHVSADQVRSTDEIDERIGVVRARTHALAHASAAIRDSAADNQGHVRDLRIAGEQLNESLTVLSKDAQAFTGYLRAS